MKLIEFIFYGMIFIFISHEANVVWSPKNWLKKKKEIKKNFTSKEKLGTEGCGTVLLQLIYAIWAFIGLFTFQWYAFAIFWVLSIIPKKVAWWSRVDAILSALLLLFILLNAVWFRIPLKVN